MSAASPIPLGEFGAAAECIAVDKFSWEMNPETSRETAQRISQAISGKFELVVQDAKADHCQVMDTRVGGRGDIMVTGEVEMVQASLENRSPIPFAVKILGTFDDQAVFIGDSKSQSSVMAVYKSQKGNIGEGFLIVWKDKERQRVFYYGGESASLKFQDSEPSENSQTTDPNADVEAFVTTVQNFSAPEYSEQAYLELVKKSLSI